MSSSQRTGDEGSSRSQCLGPCGSRTRSPLLTASGPLSPSTSSQQLPPWTPTNVLVTTSIEPWEILLGPDSHSTASTYIPPRGAAVGVALSYAILRGWGFSRSAVGLAAAVVGIWNQFALLGFPIVALALLTLQKEQNALLQTVAIIELAVLVVAAAGFAAGSSTPKLDRFVGETAVRLVNWSLRLVRRGPVSWTGDAFVRF